MRWTGKFSLHDRFQLFLIRSLSGGFQFKSIKDNGRNPIFSEEKTKHRIYFDQLLFLPYFCFIERMKDDREKFHRILNIFDSKMIMYEVQDAQSH